MTTSPDGSGRSQLGIDTYDVCGVPIAALSPGGAAALIVASRGRTAVHLCNAYTLSLVNKDPRLRRALHDADFNLADGAPVAWFGRKAGVRGPVRGSSLFRDVVRVGTATGLRHYLYGGAPDTAELASEATRLISPHAQIVGCEAPPYRDLSDAEMQALADRVRDSRADVLWVGLGTPRQDYFVHEFAPLVNCVVVPVGATFDFLSGRVREAPPFLQSTGLEWVHRLMNEPRRLWRRYFVGNPQFLIEAVRSRRTR